MKALILSAHGSRVQASNQEIFQLAVALKKLGSDYHYVEAAFLEMAEPSIESAVNTAISLGALEIDVMPYFLAAGRHVRRDIPGIVEQLQRQHPDIALHLTAYIGQSPQMAELILQQAQAAKN